MKDKLSADELTRDTGGSMADGHDIWVRERIASRLEKKKSGDMVHSSLDEVAVEFGFDAP